MYRLLFQLFKHDSFFGVMMWFGSCCKIGSVPQIGRPLCQLYETRHRYLSHPHRHPPVSLLVSYRLDTERMSFYRLPSARRRQHTANIEELKNYK